MCFLCLCLDQACLDVSRDTFSFCLFLPTHHGVVPVKFSRRKWVYSAYTWAPPLIFVRAQATCLCFDSFPNVRACMRFSITSVGIVKLLARCGWCSGASSTLDGVGTPAGGGRSCDPFLKCDGGFFLFGVVCLFVGLACYAGGLGWGGRFFLSNVHVCRNAVLGPAGMKRRSDALVEHCWYQC